MPNYLLATDEWKICEFQIVDRQLYLVDNEWTVVHYICYYRNGEVYSIEIGLLRVTDNLTMEVTLESQNMYVSIEPLSFFARKGVHEGAGIWEVRVLSEVYEDFLLVIQKTK